MKTIYISLPMSGQEDTIWERYVEAENELKHKFGDSIEIKAHTTLETLKTKANSNMIEIGATTWLKM